MIDSYLFIMVPEVIDKKNSDACEKYHFNWVILQNLISDSVFNTIDH